MSSRYDRYDEEAVDVLLAAQRRAFGEKRVAGTIGDLACALALAALPEMVALAKENGSRLDRDKIKELYLAWASLSDRVPESARLALDEDLRAVLDEAESLAGPGKVGAGHLLRAAWPRVKRELASFLITDPREEEKIEEATVEIDSLLESSDEYFDSLPGSRTETAPVGKTQAGDAPEPRSIDPDDIRLPGLDLEPRREPSILDKFGREMTAREAELPFIGRAEELDSLASILLRLAKPNPLIVGESGVGKTALVEGLAARVRAGAVPAALRGIRIYEIRLGELAAGTSVHGAFEERLTQIIAAVEADPLAVLFIDELHQLLSSNSQEGAADILKPALARGRFRCIGAVAAAEFHRHMERDTAFLRRFQVLYLKEPGKVEVREMLRGLKPRLQEHYNLAIPETALERSIALSERFLPGRRFPDKAIDLIDRAASLAAFAGDKELKSPRIARALAEIGDLRFEAALEDPSGLDGLEIALAKDVLGQETAIASLCSVLRICKRRLDLRPDRPDGAFLFTGPTGVGKTALAEALARRLAGREDALFRIDMSEFSEAHSVSRLTGAPPGYVGYGDQSLLGKALESRAGGVILLDELEKAHTQVHRLFLQILDAGRITDSYGKILSFGDTTIIATCNVGTGDGPPLGFSPKGEGEAAVPRSALRRVFSPELLGRFDAILPFRALGYDDFEAIVRGPILARANKALGSERELRLELSDELISLVASKGAPEFGARDLERAFRDLVLAPLASFIGGANIVVGSEADVAVNARRLRAFLRKGLVAIEEEGSA